MTVGDGAGGGTADARAHTAALKVVDRLNAQELSDQRPARAGGWRRRRLRVAESTGSAGDAELLHRLLLEFAIFERDTMPTAQSPAQLRTDLAAGWFGCTFLEEVLSGEPIGFTCYSINYSTFHGPSVYMIDLFVREKYRNSRRRDAAGRRGRGGHGLLLMRFCAGLALQQGCARLDWHVDDWNDEGIAFYRAQVCPGSVSGACITSPTAAALASGTGR
jgi:hypothetical protein